MKRVIEWAKEALDIEADALLNAKDKIDSDFVKAVEIAFNTKGKVIVIGVGKSGHVGAKIASTLSSTGTSSFFLHPAEAMHGDLGMIGKDDSILAISYSGKSDELINLMPHVKNFGVKIIAMSKSKSTPLAKFADAHIDISVKKEACPLNVAPTASTTLTLAMGDALAIALMKLRDFKKEDFARFHPAGALGKRLYLKAKHFLREPKDLPIVSSNTPLKDAIVVMSQGKLGNLIIEDDGKLTGIFSDGDLRRALMKDSFSIDDPIKKYMTKEPFYIDSADILAVDALKLIEQKKIQLLLIAKDGKLLGAIHIHDLIEAGVESSETK